MMMGGLMGRYTHAHTHTEMQQELHVSSLLIIIIFSVGNFELNAWKKNEPNKRSPLFL